MLEIERINNYEKKWKIQTSISKFSLLSISKSNAEPVIVNNRQIPFKNEAKMLSLTLKHTSATSHTTHRIKLSNVQSQRIQIFIKLDSKVKLHLYKALVRPLMEYPIIPNGIQAKAHIYIKKKKKMQGVQNKNLKFIAAFSDQRNKTAEELHHHYNLEPMNVRLYDAVTKLWTEIGIKEHQYSPKIDRRK